MKTVIVTGGSGFIGSEVAYQLVKQKNNVIVIDIKKNHSRDQKITFIRHDLRKTLDKRKIKKKVEYFIHLAAHIGNAAYGLTHEATMLLDNALIDINAISLAKDLKVKRFIYISSSLVYEQSRIFPFVEEEVNKIPPPLLGYSFEKLFGEKSAQAFNIEYELSYTICRLFNAYGKNSIGMEDEHGHVIADLVKKVKHGEYPVSIIGTGNQKRNFTHVRDVAKGILAVIENPIAINNTFNIGSTEEYSIKQILAILWKLTKQKKKLKTMHLEAFKKDLMRNKPNTEKAKKLLQWRSEISMEEGLRELV